MKRKFNHKKVIETIKDFINNNKIFLIFVLFSVLIGFFLRIKTIGFPIHYKGSLSDLLVVLLIGSFSYLIKSKNRYRYYLIWLFFFSLLSFANTVYYDFYQSFISINLLSTASMVGQVNDSLWAKIHFHQFLYLIFPILFIVIHKLFKKYNITEVIDNGKKVFFRTIYVCVFLFFFLLIGMSKSDIYRFQRLWNREAVVNKYGLYVYTISDLIQSISPHLNEVFGYDEASLKFRSYYSCRKEDNTPNEYTDIFKDKNVLFIHSESIQNFLIDLKINGKYVTPNYNRISKDGIYFSKFYPQISVGTSSDTEFTLNTGLMPSSSGTVFVNYYDRYYPSMVEYFNKMGYYTFSAHANNAEYWNRLVMHENLGYKDFYAKDSFVIDEEDIIGLGLSDKEFFKQLIPILKDIKENNGKFMGTIITLSNHSPFSDLEHYGDFDVSMDYTYTSDDGEKIKDNAPYLEDSSMGNYLKSSHYADESFGEFIDALENDGLLENTILVIYGDHEARLSRKDFNLLYNYDPVNNDIISEEDEEYFDVYGYNYDLLKNTPFIIYSSDTKFNKEITKVMGMYDVLPSIANMFGFKEKYSLGHDIFSDNEGIVVFPNGNVLTDSVYYSDLNDEYITFTENPIDIDYINNLKEYADNILDVSNGIIVHDLIKRESDRIGECIYE